MTRVSRRSGLTRVLPHCCSISLLILGLSASASGPRSDNFELESTVAFVSNRDHDPAANRVLAAEIYLMRPPGTHPRRLTDNSVNDGFPSLSPDGKKIVFDSSRQWVGGEPLNISDLFLMNTDGSEQTLLTRGSSASWSPDSKNIAFHASASGTGLPIRTDPGAATEDSDIFVLNVDDVLLGLDVPRNLTSNDATIDDDPDWSPDGETVIFTSHARNDDPMHSVTAEIYAISARGGGTQQLTFNGEEERAPSWSPNGARILFMCRRGFPAPGAILPTFELCVMDANGSNEVQLTRNATAELTPTWSPDGSEIMFHRPFAGRLQLFIMNADGTGLKQVTTLLDNAYPNWGELRVHVGNMAP